MKALLAVATIKKILIESIKPAEPAAKQNQLLLTLSKIAPDLITLSKTILDLINSTLSAFCISISELSVLDFMRSSSIFYISSSDSRSKEFF